jgi:rubredoxin
VGLRPFFTLFFSYFSLFSLYFFFFSFFFYRAWEAASMAERALRGTRLGATSYENDRNTDLAPRQDVAFDCPNGHHFSVPFAAEAELPGTWECRVCGAIAIAATGESPSPKKAKPPRSHWDMLMERRTVEDLEAVLAERLQVIRERRGTDRGQDVSTQRTQRRSA